MFKQKFTIFVFETSFGLGHGTSSRAPAWQA
jgi:hypothetical protein